MNQRSLDGAVMMFSLMPSEKYFCSGSSLMSTKGSAAMQGRSGEGSGARVGCGAAAAAPSRTLPTKRKPLPGFIAGMGYRKASMTARRPQSRWRSISRCCRSSPSSIA
jgi:hypothetical protein